MNNSANKKFTTLLLKWNRDKNRRQMPWKGEKDPYLIWLSEIILQQTRVEQGLPYFLRFKQKYPAVKNLALAKEDDVMRLWQGLGYYSRARNLHETAKHVHQHHAGKFPNTSDELKKLKGIGDYTAAAIASFAFGEQRAVVDGNVIRVLARVFGMATPFDTTAGKKQFSELAQKLIPANSPGEYNQAIMDFGAVVCTSQNPLCSTCPLVKICIAFNENHIDELPVRAKKTGVKSRYFNYLLIRDKDGIYIQKRNEKDIWQNLYQLPLIETSKPSKKNLNPLIADFWGDKTFAIISSSAEITQMLSHRKIHFRFIEIELKNVRSRQLKDFEKVKLKDLPNFAFPKTIHLYLKEKSLL